MANRTGQGHRLPEFDGRQRPVADVPRVQYATTPGVTDAAGLAANTVAGILDGFSRRIEDNLDIEAKIDGTRSGQIAGQDGVPERADDATIRGRAFNSAAESAVELQYDLQSRLALADYERENGMDADAFRKASGGYLKGVQPKLQEFAPQVAQRFEANYKLQQVNALSRINDRRNAAARDDMLEKSLRLQTVLEGELGDLSGRLFTAGPDNVQTVLAEMMTVGARMTDVAHQIGPDGKPLFSARERVAADLAAQQAISERVGSAWLRSQPDLLTALEEWRKGDPVIAIADDQGNETQVALREFLGPRGFAQAEKSFIDGLRTELAINAQIDAAEDRIFKEQSDGIFADYSVAAQNGTLTLADVERDKARLEPDRYLALRVLALDGGASVSDGAAVAMLTIQDIDGQDIRPQLIDSYRNGKLRRDDFLKLYERNADRLDKGARDPVTVGRDFVGNSLGKLSAELGLAQSMSIPQAEAEYEVRINEFLNKNNRQPELSETLEIAEEVRRRYSFIDVSTMITNIPVPKVMTPGERNSVTESSVRSAMEKTRVMFLRKNGGNADAMKSDPEYMQEADNLTRLLDLAIERDRNINAKRGAE